MPAPEVMRLQVECFTFYLQFDFVFCCRNIRHIMVTTCIPQKNKTGSINQTQIRAGSTRFWLICQRCVSIYYLQPISSAFKSKRKCFCNCWVLQGAVGQVYQIKVWSNMVYMKYLIGLYSNYIGIHFWPSECQCACFRVHCRLSFSWCLQLQQ